MKLKLSMIMVGVKRAYDVSNIEEEENATVHGVVLELSPMKTSHKNQDIKYFNGKLSDGKKMARLISFEPNCKLRPSLEKNQKKKRILWL